MEAHPVLEVATKARMVMVVGVEEAVMVGEGVSVPVEITAVVDIEDGVVMAEDGRNTAGINHLKCNMFRTKGQHK